MRFIARHGRMLHAFQVFVSVGESFFGDEIVFSYQQLVPKDICVPTKIVIIMVYSTMCVSYTKL